MTSPVSFFSLTGHPQQKQSCEHRTCCHASLSLQDLQISLFSCLTDVSVTVTLHPFLNKNFESADAIFLWGGERERGIKKLFKEPLFLLKLTLHQLTDSIEVKQRRVMASPVSFFSLTRHPQQKQSWERRIERAFLTNSQYCQSLSEWTQTVSKGFDAQAPQ